MGDLPVMPEFAPAERRALSLAPGEPVLLGERELSALLADPAYHESLGQPGHARHYRRSLPDGTGLHLVMFDDRAELHHDRYDPHAGPAALLLHLATDSPREALSLAAAGLAVLLRLGR